MAYQDGYFFDIQKNPDCSFETFCNIVGINLPNEKQITLKITDNFNAIITKEMVRFRTNNLQDTTPIYFIGDILENIYSAYKSLQ